MSTNTEVQSQAGTTRLCTAAQIDYKAYKRPYDGESSAPVLNLFASCFYGSAPWVLSFEAVNGEPNTYKLMEKVPGIVYFLVTNYAVSYSSGYGLTELSDTITIIDAHGSHKVKVEAL